MSTKIPVLRPQLPSLQRIAPYLGEIDESRIYSNFGPLVRRLENRLSQHFGLSSGSVGTSANGTLGLMLALMSLGIRPGSLCLIPSWTFAATPHAAVAAGLEPLFTDVDDCSWALTPDIALRTLEQLPGRVGAVLPVAPFGHPIDVEAWDRFRQQTGIAVVLDAAAGFDGLKPGSVPAVVSLHATKILGAGEGGFVVSADARFMEEFRSRSNFGFHSTRDAGIAGTNAKMSEYHAAVALASLDSYRETRDAYNRVIRSYRTCCDRLGTPVTFQQGHGDDWASTTCMARGNSGFSRKASGILARNGIDTRSWWGGGAHLQPAFSHFKHGDLSVTEKLSDSTLGLPCFPDMSGHQIETVCTLLTDL